MANITLWRVDAQRTGHFKQSQGGVPKRLLWKRFVERDLKSSPLVANNRLILPSQAGDVYYLIPLANPTIQRWTPVGYRSSRTGQNRWNPTLIGNWLFGLYHDTATSYTYLRAYEIGSRQLLWQAKLFDAAAFGSPLIVAGRIIVPSFNEIACYYTPNGSKLWHSYIEPTFASPPAASRDLAIVYAFNKGVYAFHLSSGRLQWHQSVEKGLACPCVGSDRVFVVSHGSNRGGYVYALHLQDGKVLWRQFIDTGDASPAFDGKFLYVAGLGGNLTCLSAATGAVCWSIRLKAGTSCSPSIAGNTIYLGDREGWLYAIDKRTGRQLWRYQTQGGVVGSPWILRDKVLFTSKDGYIYTFSI
ncbi:MAG: hypothetical protein KatS3mg017_0919 [Fimbriimonadales bacterium]|nr:MAG: hypothetical protein KatS3mg017_0919 [Fimbriimonadales bacterium]